jgi:hypothetical protein
VLVAVICCYLTARRYFLFAATQLHMPFNPAAHAISQRCTCQCKWHVQLGVLPNRKRTKSNADAHMAAAKGRWFGWFVWDTILYKRLEVFLEALGGFVACVASVSS